MGVGVGVGVAPSGEWAGRLEQARLTAVGEQRVPKANVGFGRHEEVRGQEKGRGLKKRTRVKEARRWVKGGLAGLCRV